MRIHTACLLVSLLAFGGIALTGCETTGDTETMTTESPSQAPSIDPSVQRFLDPSGANPEPLRAAEPQDDPD